MFPTDEDRRKFEQDLQPSNHILPQGDQGMIHDLMSELRGTLDSLNSEMETCQARLKALTAQRERDVSRMQRLHIGVAPHKRIPPEILSLIFASTVNEAPIPITRHRSMCPWNITQVCTKWRAAALPDARLWRSMALDLSSKSWDYMVPPEARSFLEHLLVHISPHNLPVAVGPVLALFSGCQHLRSIELECPSSFSLYYTDRSICASPWAQLTALALTVGHCGLQLNKFLEVLRQASNLISMIVRLSPNICQPTHLRGDVELQSLRFLTIRASEGSRIDPMSTSTLFTLLTLPSLETVTIALLVEYSPADGDKWEVFTRLVRRRCGDGSRVVFGRDNRAHEFCNGVS